MREHGEGLRGEGINHRDEDEMTDLKSRKFIMNARARLEELETLLLVKVHRRYKEQQD